MRGKIDLIEDLLAKKRKLSRFKAGDTIQVHYKIKEANTERIQIFEGVVISISGSKNSKSFTVRKVLQGVGVEKIIPFNSPNVAKISVMKLGKVRRAKLYYLRDRVGRKARIREVFISQKTNDKTPADSKNAEGESGQALEAKTAS